MDQPSQPAPIGQIRPWQWVALDTLGAIGLTVLYGLVWRELAFMHGSRLGAAGLIVIIILPAAMRRRWPAVALGLAVAAQVALTLESSVVRPAIVVAYVIYLIPLRHSRRASLWWLGGTLLVTTAAYGVEAVAAHSARGPAPATVAVISALLITVGWMAGYIVGGRRADRLSQRSLAAQQAHDALADAQRALTEQRLQIARELHDILAHSMGVIAVQAGVAHYVAVENPAEAARALASIEAASRDALRETRALLGVLRVEVAVSEGSESVEHGRDPMPGLADLGRLVARANAAGVRVDVDVTGDTRCLTAGIDLAAYRVIQEAVTNVIKHAATDHCRVTVAYQNECLTIAVTDDGPGVAGQHRVGHGLMGMRERVAMYGGQLRAARLAQRGFEVTATFPLGGAAA